MVSVVDVDGMTPNEWFIDEIVREGARRILAAALEAEVNAYFAQLTHRREKAGRHLVTQDGYHAGPAAAAPPARVSPAWQPRVLLRSLKPFECSTTRAFG